MTCVLSALGQQTTLKYLPYAGPSPEATMWKCPFLQSLYQTTTALRPCKSSRCPFEFNIQNTVNSNFQYRIQGVTQIHTPSPIFQDVRVCQTTESVQGTPSSARPGASEAPDHQAPRLRLSRTLPPHNVHIFLGLLTVSQITTIPWFQLAQCFL